MNLKRDILITGGDILPCRQVCFYYKVNLCDVNVIPLTGIFNGYDTIHIKGIVKKWHILHRSKLGALKVMYKLGFDARVNF